jgi:hypothetical protein
MGVDHRGRQIGVVERLLLSADVAVAISGKSFARRNLQSKRLGWLVTF